MKKEMDITSILESENLKYQPLEYLLPKAKKTELRALYINKTPEDFIENLPLLISVIGPSGSGKDSIIAPLIKNGIVKGVMAATNRPRRVGILNTPDESIEKYIWIRKQRKDESFQQYYNSVVAEYNLIEHTVNNGFIYGLPSSSLLKALKQEVTVLVNDNSAYKHIKEIIGKRANCLCVFIVPDSLETLWGRVKMREKGKKRLQDAIKFIADAPNVAHYFIFNSTCKDGLGDAIAAFKHLVEINKPNKKGGQL